MRIFYLLGVALAAQLGPGAQLPLSPIHLVIAPEFERIRVDGSKNPELLPEYLVGRAPSRRRHSLPPRTSGASPRP